MPIRCCGAGADWFAARCGRGRGRRRDLRPTFRRRRTTRSGRSSAPPGSIWSASPRRPPMRRACQVLGGASGFVYYVSVAGITGLQQAAQSSIETAVARLKRHSDLPSGRLRGLARPHPRTGGRHRPASPMASSSARRSSTGRARRADAARRRDHYVRSLADAVASAARYPHELAEQRPQTPSPSSRKKETPIISGTSARDAGR